MSDDTSRGGDSLILVARGNVAVTSSLVRRGLSLLDAQQPTGPQRLTPFEQFVDALRQQVPAGWAMTLERGPITEGPTKTVTFILVEEAVDLQVQARRGARASKRGRATLLYSAVHLDGEGDADGGAGAIAAGLTVDRAKAVHPRYEEPARQDGDDGVAGAADAAQSDNLSVRPDFGEPARCRRGPLRPLPTL